MPSSILEQITDNIKSSLEAITIAGGYSFEPAVVEYQRMQTSFNGQLPYIEIISPNSVVEAQAYLGSANSTADMETIEYIIYVFFNYDDRKSTQTPITKQYINAVVDLKKALMQDHTRGGLATNTLISEYGFVMEESNNGADWAAVLSFQVQAFIDSDDPYSQG